MTREEVKKLIEVYGKAWETQDPELITTIFTDDATYHDPREPENSGIDAIKEYWVYKVVGEQKDIHFHLRNLWIDGTTAIAEWDADFIDTKRNLKIAMSEVAIFEMRDGLFSSLREYYKTIKTPLES